MGRGDGVSKSNPVNRLLFVGTRRPEGSRHGEAVRLLHGSGRQCSHGLELRWRRQSLCGYGAVISAVAEGGGRVTGRNNR